MVLFCFFILDCEWTLWGEIVFCCTTLGQIQRFYCQSCNCLHCAVFSKCKSPCDSGSAIESELHSGLQIVIHDCCPGIWGFAAIFYVINMKKYHIGESLQVVLLSSPACRAEDEMKEDWSCIHPREISRSSKWNWEVHKEECGDVPMLVITQDRKIANKQK